MLWWTSVIRILGMHGQGSNTDTCSGGVFLDMEQGDEYGMDM